MTSFLDAFPVVNYDIQGKSRAGEVRTKRTITICNIMFRIAMVRETLSNISAYYLYTIKDFDRPETLANRVYGDPEAHWMIILANDMMNPYDDWPRDMRTFQKFIADKYGSLSVATQTAHHYEKVITREHVTSGKKSQSVYQIDYDAQTSNTSPSLGDVPYDTYLSLPASSYRTFTIGDDDVIETVETRMVSMYDYEDGINESKRNIKVIKPDYYASLLTQFNTIVGANPSFMRSLT